MSFAIPLRKDVASKCLLLSFMLQLQSPEEPEFFLCYCDGSQHRFCQPAVADLGGEPWGGGGGGTDKAEQERGLQKAFVYNAYIDTMGLHKK